MNPTPTTPGPTLPTPTLPPAPGLEQGSLAQELLGTPLMIFAVLVAAILIRWLLHRLINRTVDLAGRRAQERLAGLPSRAGRILADAAGLAHDRQQQRAATMGALLRSVVTVVVFGIALLTVMATLGVPLAPLLASAGVGGVALGFGAQSLVRDFLSGIFMILEDQFGVGDLVDVGGLVGTIEDVSLRVTRLRDGDGVVWYVRNGEITRVGNTSQGWSTAIVDLPFSAEQKVPRLLGIVSDVLRGMDQDDAWSGKLLEPPEVAGVESLAGGVVTVRILAKCAPTEHLAVQREIRHRTLAALDDHGIRVAGPQQPGPGASAAADPSDPLHPRRSPAGTPKVDRLAGGRMTR